MNSPTQSGNKIRNAISIFRYALILPVACVAWLVVFFIGVQSLNWSARLFCPEGSGSGSDCYAPSWQYVEMGMIVFWSGISAVVVVWISLLLAPNHKAVTGMATYIVGAAVATWFAVETSMWLGWCSAVIAGVIPLVKANIGIGCAVESSNR